MADSGFSNVNKNNTSRFIGQNNPTGDHISNKTDVHNKTHATDNIISDYDVEGENCDFEDRPLEGRYGVNSNFLPRLVFHDSDEIITGDYDSINQHETFQSKEERSASDSQVFTQYENSALHFQTDGFSNPVGLSENSLLNSQHSRGSVHSSDSDLLMDHSMPVQNELHDVAEEDFEKFLSEHESDAGDTEWHCHDAEVKVPPDKMARNQLLAVTVLCFLFMIGETIGGILANSLALFTDVLHLGSDFISFLISLLAIYLSKKPATTNMSFGYHRAEVLGALISVFIIWGVTGVLIYVATERIIQEHYKEVKPDEMLITAVLGVVFNIIMGIVLHSEICCGGSRSRPSFGHGHSHGSHSSHNHHHDNCNGVQRPKNRRPKRNDYEPLADEENLQMVEGEGHGNPDFDNEINAQHPKNINVRAAFIHVIGDIIQSLGVLLASVIMKLKPEDQYKLADPICTFLFSILVLFTTVNVLKDTLRIILEGVPRDTSYDALRSRLQSIPGVKAVHGLTVWCLTLEKNAMAVHLAIDTTASHERVLTEAYGMLKEHYSFVRTTVQVEYYKPEVMDDCRSCQDSKK